MKITADRRTLLKALQLVGSAISPQTVKARPVYGNVLVTATIKGDLVLEATDLETTVRQAISGVEVDRGGKALLPFAKMQEILKIVEDETIRIETTSKSVEVESFAASYSLLFNDPSDFGTMDTGTGETSCTIAPSVLRKACEQTVIAAATDEGKYSMRAVLFGINKFALDLVATDGKRLAVVTVPTIDCDAADGSYLLPPKMIHLVIRTLADVPDETPVLVSLRTHATISVGGVTIVSRLVEGRFPPYSKVLQESKTDTVINVESSELLKVVKQAALMRDQDNDCLDVELGADELTMSMETKNGKSSVTLPINNDKVANVSLSAQYLRDMLTTIDDEIAMHMGSPKHSVVFRRPNWVHLIVPITRS